MLDINNQSEKRKTVLAVHGTILLMLSLLLAVQGVFEIIDYIPYIISTGSMSCVAYIATIPATLIMYILLGIAVNIYYYNSSEKLMRLLPAAMIIGIAPSLAYDLIFIYEKGFVADGEYNILVYLIMDIILLLDSVVMIQFVKGTMTKNNGYDMSACLSDYGNCFLFERICFLRLGGKHQFYGILFLQQCYQYILFDNAFPFSRYEIFRQK